MRRTYFCYMIILYICIYYFSSPSFTYAIQPSISAHNAVLMDQSTGQVLFEKRAQDKTSIASITKIMTALIAIESANLEEETKASRRAIHTEGSSIYLEQGEVMSIEDLLYGLMLRSGNDAAVVLAEHIGETEEGFVYLMNQYASWIGMTATRFANAHGLEADDHYSTAYDMALLTRYAMENATFKALSRTKSHQAKSRSYAWMNKNKLLLQYQSSTGGKTGYTKKAGRTLVSTASQDGSNLIVVTLNAPDDWNDHRKLFEYGFKQLNHSKGTITEPVEGTPFIGIWKQTFRRSIGIVTNG